MDDVVIETKKFVEKIEVASCDSHVDGKKKYAITLGMIIEEAFQCLVETEEDWSYIDLLETLLAASNRVGFKKVMLAYRSERALYKALCEFDRETDLSELEKSIFSALKLFDFDQRWNLYLMLYKSIDKWLGPKSEENKVIPPKRYTIKEVKEIWNDTPE